MLSSAALVGQESLAEGRGDQLAHRCSRIQHHAGLRVRAKLQVRL